MLHRRRTRGKYREIRGHAAHPRGQSLVEFALVLPMLLVLLLGVSDFGRVFSAGVVLEASTRDAAEIAAIERLREKPSATADPSYYARLHELAASTACDESRKLPTFDGLDTCPSGATDRNGNTSWFVRACVHDTNDPTCDAPSGYTGSPPSGACPNFDAAMSNSVPAVAASYYVEVRTCYKFETLFNLQLSLPMNTGLSLGDIWLERTRMFVVDCGVGSDPNNLSTNCPNA